MAKVQKTKSGRYKVVNSVNGVPVKGGRSLKTRAAARRVRRATEKRNR